MKSNTFNPTTLTLNYDAMKSVQSQVPGNIILEKPVQTQEVPAQASNSQENWSVDITPIAVSGMVLAFCWAIIKRFQYTG